MWRKILTFFRILFWWIVIIAMVALIGFVLWPLVQNKTKTMSTEGWDTPAYSDVLQQRFEGQLKSIFGFSRDATTEILSDESGKISVNYVQDSEDVYRPVDTQIENYK